MSTEYLQQIQLAYCAAFTAGNKGYLGAALVTDYKGFPLEFRYTDPIVPTKIQQVLYGKGLEKYIKIDVITDNLLKVLSHDVSLVIVQDEDLLEFKGANKLIIRLSSTKSPPLSAPGDIQNLKKCEYLLQTSHSANPIRVQFPSDFNCESEEYSMVMKILAETGSFIDVDEPLSRVYKTVDLICAQDS